MKKIKNINLVVFATSFTLLLFVAGCSGGDNLWGDPENALIMSYRLQDNGSLNYASDNSMKMDMQIMGQNVETESIDKHNFTTGVKDVKGDDIVLGIVFNSSEGSVKSMQGEQKSDFSGIIGKGFDLTVTKYGEEKGITNEDDFKSALDANSYENITRNFSNLFPTLSQNPVKIGDSWLSYDTVNVDVPGSKITLMFTSDNKYEGLESVMGYDCAKIVSTVKGTMGGDVTQQGMDFKLEGTIDAIDTWYFAYQEGILVKYNSDGTTDANVSGMMGMTIPMKMKNTNSLELVK
ncbi:MAG: hypothetical protein JXA68_06075 [Ignavibacteriales bacterium]|nr:hypothetical protein [Ignavibacteriales bacterium]